MYYVISKFGLVRSTISESVWVDIEKNAKKDEKPTAQTWWIISKWAADYSISLKFGTGFDNVKRDVQQMFKDNGSKVEVIAWRKASAAKTL